MPRFLSITKSFLFVAASCALFAAPTNAADPYARVTENRSGQVTLEMCERTFKPIEADGPRIHLISVIHIADKSFYDAMQTLLESYDSVLFEGVKPAGLDPIDPQLEDQDKANATADRLDLLTQIAAQYTNHTGSLPESFDDLLASDDPRIVAIISSIQTDGWGQPIAMSHTRSMDNPSSSNQITFTSNGADFLPAGEGVNADITKSWTHEPNRSKKAAPEGVQTQLADALHVEFQLDAMDMTGKGWINADIDINELQAQLAEMGEDNAMILQLIEGNSFQAKLIGFVLKFVKRSPTMSSMMKLAMMDMLALVETTNMLSQFEAIEKVILLGRNDIVIEYLKAELANNPEANDIAIFYGAGHMPGIEHTILTEMGYKFESNTWAQAMTVNTKDTGLSQAQVKMMRNMIKNSLENQF
ncbi:MAG: hypothetical protein JKX70_06695 [Phycisphaerales bacterium]|nr:hypothetical protein [Phycisphaerales bacterium]